MRRYDSAYDNLRPDTLMYMNTTALLHHVKKKRDLERASLETCLLNDTLLTSQRGRRCATCTEKYHKEDTGLKMDIVRIGYCYKNEGTCSKKQSDNVTFTFL